MNKIYKYVFLCLFLFQSIGVKAFFEPRDRFEAGIGGLSFAVSIGMSVCWCRKALQNWYYSASRKKCLAAKEKLILIERAKEEEGANIERKNALSSFAVGVPGLRDPAILVGNYLVSDGSPDFDQQVRAAQEDLREKKAIYNEDVHGDFGHFENIGFSLTIPFMLSTSIAICAIGSKRLAQYAWGLRG